MAAAQQQRMNDAVAYLKSVKTAFADRSAPRGTIPARTASRVFLDARRARTPIMPLPPETT